MTPRHRVARLIDSATIMLAIAGIVVLGVRLVRHRPANVGRRPALLPVAALAPAAHDDSTAPFPSGQRLSRLQLFDLVHAGIAVGDSTPVVRVVVFADYGCGWCAAFDSTLTVVMARYPDLVGVVYEPLLLDTLASAPLDVQAAAFCAAEMGSFSRFHRVAYRNQSWVSAADGWRRIARSAGINDRGGFERCVLGDRYRANVLAITREARSLGFVTTPSEVIGSRPVVGNVSLAVMDSFVALAVADGRRAPQ